MPIPILRRSAIPSSEITDEAVYLQRRSFMRRVALGMSVGATGVLPVRAEPERDRPNSWDDITHYNNFYEYSTDKRAVATLAQNLAPHPWTIRIEGEVEQPLVVDIDQLIQRMRPQQRIYRLRCVEGWSMVIPWDGIPLASVLALVQPTSRARYVKFVSLHDPARMFGQRRATLPWPYTEALTIAEAMHPLTLLATGLYGKPLPNQNGAPARLVVPWKYGFKSIKSIVTIRFEQQQPLTTWPQVSKDFGFHANVDPRAAFGRGTQSRENRIGELQKRPTLLFNGYAEEVAHLYSGVDLERNI